MTESDILRIWNGPTSQCNKVKILKFAADLEAKFVARPADEKADEQALRIASEMEKGLLRRASAEIRGLRRENEILTAQMGVVEVFAAALGLKRAERGAAVDVAWELDKAATEVKTELKEA